MQWYLSVVKAYPVFSAMVQFAILGTLGDCVAKWIQNKKIFMPFSPKEAIYKPIEWAILAVFIKFAFIGFTGFVDALVFYGYLPRIFASGFFHAFAISKSLRFGLVASSSGNT
jgi:hypothetical protein